MQIQQSRKRYRRYTFGSLTEIRRYINLKCYYHSYSFLKNNVQIRSGENTPRADIWLIIPDEGCESYDKSDGKYISTLCDKLYSYYVRLGLQLWILFSF